jgi:uncharacterized protein YjiS (DUF1127 family)
MQFVLLIADLVRQRRKLIHPFRNRAMSDLLVTRLVSFRPSAGRVSERHPLRWLGMALRTYLTRQALPELSPRELADIGVSSSAAVAEAARLPWDTNSGPRRHRASIVGAIQRMLERDRSRRLIARMSARDLRDIGLGPTDAQFEVTKFFWEI